MALFQPSVLKDQLRLQDEQQLNAAYKKFTGFFHNPEIQENIRSSKEEQFQATFLNELFVKVLGYTMNPQPEYNLTTEFKNQKNARKADGAILKDGQAVGVIELKGTNTKHLEGIRQQAFDYKANHKGCVYVITSNFEKLRFYINDATEFVEFDLFELNREDFSLLWFCLHRENLLSGKPLKSKEASLVEEEVITKQFYKDYSVFKRELYRDLVKRNAKRLKNSRPPGYESDAQDPDAQAEMTGLEKNVKQNLFKKSQKLIDRFLFIFFAEDRALLPPNSIHKILSDWNKLKDLDAEMPLYDRFKLYFGYLDTGRKGTDKKTEIFAYNGGLFKPDPVLDMLEIDDELLYKHTSRLATYDFESQVDVNILGHIFENSLNEIESVNAEIEGADFDKQKSKRKKDGVFYTPKYITKYIVENTVGRLCEEKKSELGFREEEYFRGRKRRQKDTLESLVKILEDYREWLLQLTICDPACGSGAFLNQALDFLIKEHKYIDEMKAKLLGGRLILSDIENTILERNIYGVDINEESVEIAKLSLWLRTAQPRRKLNDLSNSIKCGNSLIDDKKVAGNKAFKWEAEFPEVFAKGGFDVVIGNPPYGASLNKIEKSYLKEKFKESYSGFDTYFFFFEESIRLSNKNGFLGLITPNTFLVLENASALRKYLLENTRIDSLLEVFNVFPDAIVEPITTVLRKNKRTKNINVYLVQRNLRFQAVENAEVVYLKQKLENIIDSNTLIINYKLNNSSQVLLNRIYSQAEPLSSFITVKAGVKPYEKGKGNPPQTADTLKEKPFTSPEKVDQTFKKCIRGGNIRRYLTCDVKEYISYGEWLAAPRKPSLFEEPKIFMRRTDDNLYSDYDDTGAVGINSVHCIQKIEDNNEVDLLRILSILNSKLLNWIFRTQNFHMVGKPMAEVKTIFIERLPYKPFSDAQNSTIDFLVPKAKRLTQQLLHHQDRFLSFIASQFQIEKFPKKLQSWHELEFGDFIKELNKAIKASNKVRAKEAAVLAGEGGDAPTVVEVPFLSKKDEFEWMELFEENKKKAVELQREIEQTDKEIDAMVYELYGLTEEEIKIVEGA